MSDVMERQRRALLLALAEAPRDFSPRWIAVNKQMFETLTSCHLLTCDFRDGVGFRYCGIRLWIRDQPEPYLIEYE